MFNTRTYQSAPELVVVLSVQVVVFVQVLVVQSVVSRFWKPGQPGRWSRAKGTEDRDEVSQNIGVGSLHGWSRRAGLPGRR